MAYIELNKLSPALFPTTEDDEFEFKSSQDSSDKVKTKLSCAASAFANSGGGCFIWGVDNKNGDADGGVDDVIGRQTIRDWVDNIVHQVEPAPSYSVQLYSDNEGRGFFNPGKVIVAVSVHPSAVVPHMAGNKKYYIRAGAHTVAAGHFLVEALWARRQVGEPSLVPMLTTRKSSEVSGHDVYLGIVNLTNVPAVDVQVTITGLQHSVKGLERFFPVHIPVVDQRNPYYMWLAPVAAIEAGLPKDAIATVRYKDLAGNKFETSNEAPLIDAIPPNFRGW